jgi:hypothetical protein
MFSTTAADFAAVNQYLAGDHSDSGAGFTISTRNFPGACPFCRLVSRKIHPWIDRLLSGVFKQPAVPEKTENTSLMCNTIEYSDRFK